MQRQLHVTGNVRLLRYTLIELLASMGIFLILMAALLQFFSSARTLWVTSSHRNDLYANARVAMDLIGKDLQNAMYQNDDTPRGFYPFWYRQRVDDPQVSELNFMTKTELKPIGAESDICEVRYTFVSASGPVLKDHSNALIPEGWLVRSCVGDNDTIGRYNFAEHSFSNSDSGRMLDIWSDVEDRYTPVIPGVIAFDITCYSDVENTFPPMLDSEMDSKDIGSGYYKGRLGTMFPMIINIRIKLMDQSNWKIYMKFRRRWSDLMNSGKVADAEKVSEEIKILRKKAVRTFSKTIYLKKRSSS